MTDKITTTFIFSLVEDTMYTITKTEPHFLPTGILLLPRTSQMKQTAFNMNQNIPAGVYNIVQLVNCKFEENKT